MIGRKPLAIIVQAPTLVLGGEQGGEATFWEDKPGEERAILWFPE